VKSKKQFLKAINQNRKLVEDGLDIIDENGNLKQSGIRNIIKTNKRGKKC
jgi:hypothetical protein